MNADVRGTTDVEAAAIDPSVAATVKSTTQDWRGGFLGMTPSVLQYQPEISVSSETPRHTLP